MRHFSLVALAGACALAGCHDTIPGPLGPNTQLTLHFDSLSHQATAAAEPNRVAALDLALRSLADGALPGLLILSKGSGVHDTATYTTVTWSMATVIKKVSTDSLTDSLQVFVGWRGTDADTMIVLRAGNPSLAPQVQAELATLGLTSTHLVTDTTDTVTSAAFVTGNTVALADSGSIEGDFRVFGTACQFIAVTAIQNDNNTVQQCTRELLVWQFGVRFSSASTTLGLGGGYSPGVVVVR